MKPTRSTVWNDVPRLLIASFFLAVSTLCAAEEKAPAFKPAMREVAPGIFEIGKVRLDKNTNSLSFPCKLNMDNDLIEYLICTPSGATHESLFVTEVQPNELHLGMLLLGAKGAGLLAPAAADAPPAQIDAEYLKRAPKLKGDNILITAKWKNKEGREQTSPVEDWILNTDTSKPATRGPWMYTGSMFANELFLAQYEGVVAALITNPAALINNPRKGNDSDRSWEVNTKAVPPVTTEVEVTFKIEPAKEKP